VELHQLRYVLMVAETKSFSRAAERLFVVQSNVSAQVRKLEHELGVDLFERRPHEVILTAFGRAFVPRVKATMAALEEARLSVDTVRGLGGGRASLGIAGSLVGWLMPDTLRRFRECWPGIDIWLTEQPSVILASMVASRDLPQAMVQGTNHKPDVIDVTPLFEEDLVAVVPDGHRLMGEKSAPLKAFSDEDLLLPELGNQMRDLIVSASESVGFSPISRIEVSSKHLARELAQKGIGVGIVPAMTAIDDAGGVTERIVRIVDPPLTRKVGLARHRRASLAPADEAMGNVLQDVIAILAKHEVYSNWLRLC
jgi:DNA-binding transcriptional LysR family regulator